MTRIDKDTPIAVIGLGYVGLPLAVAFARYFKVTGFDTKQKRIEELHKGYDSTLEITEAQLLDVKSDLSFSSDISELQQARIYIITVPTPIDKFNHPDLSALYKASETVGQFLKKGDIVIYESTVYPGVTEDECAPVLERVSGLKFNVDFHCGYSPERINPGDKEHTLTQILKITSGSTPAAADRVDELYRTIITAGTYRAPSIKVAEAAKVIENAQRDINIAFVNELAKIFNLIGLNTLDILEAAGTKWNFLNFKPGLVGGHCIGVDPYYLAQKAQEAGYHPEIILAGRRLNDGMGQYIADEVIKLMVRKQIQVTGSEVLILGFTFKENCPDVRNTRVIDIVTRLKEYHVNVCILDPWADPAHVYQEYGITCQNEAITGRQFDAVIGAVAHAEFKELDLQELCKENTVIYDIKGMLPEELIHGRL
ncbi:UDP-N-acetyl-D-galactosamine dehydrogenase [Pedobacter cryoconitis]|uniref:UDP-N-acetyl-D-galactosamine dehydrogenase n=1 Tax=Pedobacter cryoconitis TaxID=188932 RepID=A0A7W8YPH9_9SPHI|nr:nucleotide sugar dehydrogenase [Pedobacter cryoconitis]MBB5619185.1 UDP-N-acetyl-D-galactosamine dehydrogenase [Pedobacter cryoconitis]